MTATAGTTYSYAVRAFDVAGNRSPFSNALSATTPSIPAPSTCGGPAQDAFTGCYYPTVDLSGSPSLIRTDPQINFDWSYTMPDQSLSPNGFSVRWQGSFLFDQATYTFTATTSDGMRLYIDGKLILDRWRSQPITLYRNSIALTSGRHTIAVEYFTYGGSPVTRLSWQKPTSTVPAPVVSLFTSTPSAIPAGQSATLSWSVSGASSITIDNGVGDVSNTTTKVVSPTQTTTYKLTASNSGGIATGVTTVTVSPPTTTDSQPPTAPVLSSAVAMSPTRVDLAWNARSDNVAVTGYQVVRNSAVLATVPSTALAYSDASAAPKTAYTYTVTAFDAARNYSSPSNAMTVTTPDPPVATDCQPGIGMFTGCYYPGTDLAGSPVLIRTDPQINFNWGSSAPAATLSAANFSVRWQGTFALQQGMYTFSAGASDGMRIYVDGILILDRWRDQPLYTYRIQRPLSQGNHNITIEFYSRTGTPIAQFSFVKQ